MPNQNACGAWMLGGGADFRAEYALGPLRGKLDFLRTQFAHAGQSRLRAGIGMTYTFGNRER